jgi:hypothetical protein
VSRCYLEEQRVANKIATRIYAAIKPPGMETALGRERADEWDGR